MHQLVSFDSALEYSKPFAARQHDVRDRLRSIHEELQGAPVWPWNQGAVNTYRDRTLPFLYALLRDHEEAAAWNSAISEEMQRLEACSVPF